MTKKRSLWLINEHFESVFNAVYASAIVFQRFLMYIRKFRIMLIINYSYNIKNIVKNSQLFESFNLKQNG